MNHEPISLAVEWLRASITTTVAPTVTSMLDPRDPLPAVIVARVLGAPLDDATGIDTVYDWTLTVYCRAGKTGPGNDLPDTQTAHQLAAAVVAAARTLPSDRFTNTAGTAQLVSATVLSVTRATDEADNAIATVTLNVRVQE
jgi:hypothetical protein